MKNEKKEANNFIKEGGKLDTWQEQDINVVVNKPVFNKKSGKVRIKSVVKKHKERVFNTQGIKTKLSCKEGNHYFVMKDKHKYIAKCKYCMLCRKIYPVTHDIVNGQIVEI